MKKCSRALCRLTLWSLLAAMCLLPAGALGEQPLTVDMDLAGLSSTVVYSQLYNIFMDVESYIGRVIRISGFLDVYEDPETGKTYFSCIVPDAAACCAQGLEFDWAGDHAYPQDYPQPGAPMTVVGTFEIYEEDGYEFARLAGAQVEWQ